MVLWPLSAWVLTLPKKSTFVMLSHLYLEVNFQPRNLLILPDTIPKGNFCNVHDEHSSTVHNTKNVYVTQMLIDSYDGFKNSQFIYIVKYFTAVKYIAVIIIVYEC